MERATVDPCWPWPFDQADQVDHARLRVTRPVPAFGLERGDVLFMPLEDADRQDQPTEVLIVRQGRAWARQLRPVDLLPPAPALGDPEAS